MSEASSSDGNTKRFHLSDVLSITTGRLVSARGMEGIYDILNWMSGDNLFTHQLPRVMKEAAPVLLQSFPQLSEVDAEAEINPGNIEVWTEIQVKRFGEFFDVPKLNEDQHERIDPISELVEKIHPSKIIILDTGSDGGEVG